jgi:hypothetical protein
VVASKEAKYAWVFDIGSGELGSKNVDGWMSAAADDEAQCPRPCGASRHDAALILSASDDVTLVPG